VFLPTIHLVVSVSQSVALSLRSLHATPNEILGLDGAFIKRPKLKPPFSSKLSACLKLLGVRHALGLRPGCSNHQSSDENRSNHFQPPRWFGLALIEQLLAVRDRYHGRNELSSINCVM
jgi:hypothetical protein